MSFVLYTGRIKLKIGDWVVTVGSLKPSFAGNYGYVTDIMKHYVTIYHPPSLHQLETSKIKKMSSIQWVCDNKTVASMMHEASYQFTKKAQSIEALAHTKISNLQHEEIDALKEELAGLNHRRQSEIDF